MDRYARWNKLLEMLAEAGQIGIDETAEQLGVSAATIRRDIDELATQQLLTRTRGGATAHSVAYDLPLRYKAARHAPEKQRIAAAAAGLIAAGSTVGINGGTTTSEVARALATRADLNAGTQRIPITVVTNALNIANEFVVRPHVQVVVTGGAARQQSYELIGPIASDMLDAVALDMVILGVDAIDVEHGASAHNDGEAMVNRAMAARAGKVVVVADGSKLGKRAFARICTIGEVDTLITDSGAPADVIARFTDIGLQVVTA